MKLVGGCPIQARGPQTARFSPAGVEARFWLEWGCSDLPRAPGLRLVLALVLEIEIERHCSADEILQGRLIDLASFVDVDGAPDIPVEAGVE
jgi:hypothetical protein